MDKLNEYETLDRLLCLGLRRDSDSKLFPVFLTKGLYHPILTCIISSYIQNKNKGFQHVRKIKDAIRITKYVDRGITMDLQGHEDNIYSICYSPDGQFIASGSDDKTVRIWSIPYGRCISVLRGHDGRVNSVCYSPDGRYIASGGYDYTIRVWNVNKMTCVSVITGHTSWVRSICYSPDGRFICSSSSDKTVKVWDVSHEPILPTGNIITCLATLEGHTRMVNSVCYSPDGKYIASGSDDGTVRVWNVANFTFLYSLMNHDNYIHSVCWSPNGQFICSGCNDGFVRVWDVSGPITATKRCVFILPVPSWSTCMACYSPNGQFICASSYEGSIIIWDVTKPTSDRFAKIVLHCRSSNQHHGIAICYSPNGEFLACGSKEILHHGKPTKDYAFYT